MVTMRQQRALPTVLVAFCLLQQQHDHAANALKVFPRGVQTAVVGNNDDAHILSAAIEETQILARECRAESGRNPLSIEARFLTAVRRGAIESFQSKMVPEDPNPNNKHNPLWVEEYVYTGERRGPEMKTEKPRKQKAYRVAPASKKR